MSTRKWLTENYELMIDMEIEKRKGPSGPFPSPTPVVEIPDDAEEWDDDYLLIQERDVLGFYISGHPLHGNEGIIKRLASANVSDLEEKDGKWVTVAGVVTFVEKKRNKTGMDWASVFLEDLSGSVECLFFPSSYKLVCQALVVGVIAAIKGRVDGSQLIATELSIPDLDSGSSKLGVDSRLSLFERES